MKREARNETGATLTRSDAASLIGCSVRTVRGMEKRGEIRFVVGEDGVRRFASVEVLRAAKDLRARTWGDGEKAVRILELLEEGRGLSEIVRRLRASVDLVETVVRMWREGRAGDLVIPGKVRRRLGRFITFEDAYGIVARVAALVSDNERLREANAQASNRILDLIGLIGELVSVSVDARKCLADVAARLSPLEMEILSRVMFGTHESERRVSTPPPACTAPTSNQDRGSSE